MPKKSRRRWRNYLIGESGDLTGRSSAGKKAMLFVLVATFLIALETFVNICGAVLGSMAGVHWTWAAPVSLLVLLIVLFALSRFVAWHSGGALVVNPQPHPGCKALIVFLSPPDAAFGSSIIERSYLDCQDSITSADDMRKVYERSPWRQPLLAIYAHLTRLSSGRLSHIVVIPSRDHPEYEKTLKDLYETHHILPSQTDASAKLAEAAPQETAQLRLRRGTVRTVGAFRETLLLLGTKLGVSLDVVRGTNINPRWQDGVDFESASELAAILQDGFRYLEEEASIAPRDVLVDITSGNALCSAVGAAIAIDQNRRFQWVSVATDKVIPYEIEYVRPED